jgi:hypothetical protein
MHGSRVTRTVSLALLFSLLAISPTFAKEIDSRGTYNGFFQSTQNRGLWGFMTFDIGEVRNHRFMGMVTMLVNGQTKLPFSADGTVSTSGEFTGNGSGPGGRVQFHGQIEFLDGGAAIADATYFFMPMGSNPPMPDRGTATLIRDFVVGPDQPVPIVGGSWDGVATSSINGSQLPFHLDATQKCNGEVPGTEFFGKEFVDPRMPFFFLGSINGDGRLISAAWSFTNDRVIITGQENPPPIGDAVGAATVTAQYVIFFGDGSVDRGTVAMGQVGIPPDPCRIIIGQ